MSLESPSVLVLYHYLYPDNVVSAVHISDLCTGLAARGWKVTASACNRGCRDDREVFPRRMFWQGVEFRRVWRPAFRQASGPGRMANSAWMILAWSAMALNPRVRPDVLIIGTDPVLSVVVAIFWRVMRPRIRIAHWCFDLYPEIAFAAGLSRKGSLFAGAVQHLIRLAYQCCDLIVDIGMCMRKLLAGYRVLARFETIAPWALVETNGPAAIDVEERAKLFGETRLGLLYSGTFGRAHSWSGIPQLASALGPLGKVVFSVQGNCADELREAMAGAPITFAPFASSERLHARLSAADVHIVTLRESWTGTVVPSKFFGALAMGRPVLFIGGRDSAIAEWIERFQIGWVLSGDNLTAVAEDLNRLADCAEKKASLFSHCHDVYTTHFSTDKALNRWDRALRNLCLDRTG